MIPVRTFEGRDVAVFGLARTGLAAARALKAGGARVHAWDDSEKTRAAAEAEGVELSDINAMGWGSFAALVLSPGVPLTHPEPHRIVALAKATGVPIIGDIELLAREVNATPPAQRPKVIGITGTNGKSTETALIGHILAEAGKDVRMGGNIGRAVLDLAPLHAGAYYVLELSSYQLDLTDELRCDVAIWMNITPDHLDRHGDMKGYVAAKKRIFANQGAGDFAIIGVDDDISSAVCTEAMIGARIVTPISSRLALSKGVCAIGSKLFDATGPRADMVADLANAPALQGRHNGQNAAAAYAACRALNIEPRIIAKGLESFPGLAHRLENVATVQGVRFVNDSKATNADAAAQALAVWPRVYWIAGGLSKEGGIEPLRRFFPRLAGTYLIGKSAESFAKTLEGRENIHLCGDLETATAKAFADAKASGEKDPIVLLSPAAASQDQFKDFEDRGDQFKAIVTRLGEEKPKKRSGQT
ncbi:MAG: UDP-N-acetylmuramoyl-L-alanine--D-glutamate ligase [Hyphomonadaceae bacterium]